MSLNLPPNLTITVSGGFVSNEAKEYSLYLLNYNTFKIEMCRKNPFCTFKILINFNSPSHIFNNFISSGHNMGYTASCAVSDCENQEVGGPEIAELFGFKNSRPFPRCRACRKAGRQA